MQEIIFVFAEDAEGFIQKISFQLHDDAIS